MTRTQFLIIRLLLAACAALAMLGIGWIYKHSVQTKEKVWNESATRIPVTPIAVQYDKDFERPTNYAISLWNNIMPAGKPLFLESSSGESMVKILSANGAPCGQETEHESEGHAATTYQCPGGIWEVHVSKPGDIHDQLYIIAHEMGHVLGLADDESGDRVMRTGIKKTPDMILVSDKDADAVVQRYQ